MSNFVKVTTVSGSEYSLLWDGKSFRAVKNGRYVGCVIGAFPENVQSILSTATSEQESTGSETGYDEKGHRTCRFIASYLAKGMILCNRRGLRSTTIEQVTYG